MLKKYSRSLTRVFAFIDILSLVLSFWLVSYWRFGSDHLNLFAHQVQYQMLFAVYMTCWLYLSVRFHLYSSRRGSRFKEEMWDICKTASLCLMMASVSAFFIRQFPVSRIFLIHLWVFQTLLLIASRFLFMQSLQYIRRRGYNYRNVLIIGHNSRSVEMTKRIEGTPDLGLRILGVVDSLERRGTGQTLKERDLMGTLEDLETILRKNVVDEVLIFLPIKSFYVEIQEIILTCEMVGVEAKIPTDLFTPKISRATISRYDGIPVIDLYTSPKMSWQLFVKRLMDMMASGILLLLLSPLFLLVAFMIKATSQGPVFFVQRRVGYNGRQFSCIKFRTMVQDAEERRKELVHLNELTGPVFKVRNDPRVTQPGRLLRKMSIDELPQLINVFWGDMSLVGPRPPIQNEVDQYPLNDRRRLSMKPGITCLWQVNGRNRIPFEKWMELDREYIDQWSLTLDFKILARTIPAVLRGSGAS